MPSYIAPIEHTRTLCLKPVDGLRYGNFEGVVHLPPVSKDHAKLGLHSYSALNNQQIYKTICDWFQAYRPWQQKALLYGIVDRCAERQLNVVLTSLEPVRHRDYVTAQRKSYPSTPFRKQRGTSNDPRLTKSQGSQFIHSLISDSETTSCTQDHAVQETDDSLSLGYLSSEPVPCGSEQEYPNIDLTRFAGDLAGEIVKDALEEKLIEELRQSLTLALCPPLHDEDVPDNAESERLYEIEDPSYVQKYAETLALNILKDALLTGLEKEKRLCKFITDASSKLSISASGDSKFFQAIDEEKFVQSYAESLSVKVLDDSIVRSQLFGEKEETVISFAETFANQVLQMVLQEHSDEFSENKKEDNSAPNQVDGFAEQISQNIISCGLDDFMSSEKLTEIPEEKTDHAIQHVEEQLGEPEILDLSNSRPYKLDTVLHNLGFSADQANNAEVPVGRRTLRVVPPIKITRIEDDCVYSPVGGRRPSEIDRAWSRLSRCSTDVVRYSLFGSGAVSTPDFFLRSNIKQFGDRILRTGLTTNKTHVHIPDCFSVIYFTSNFWTKQLGAVFSENRMKIGIWMDLWEDYEKITLLKDLLKLCEPDILSALSSYIQQRLHDFLDMNRLTDRLLLYILSFLTPDEIRYAAQVCRRWRYLCATDEMWMIKCHEIGVEEGIENIDEIVQKSSRQTMGIDWKLAYAEVLRLTTVMKMGLSLFSLPPGFKVQSLECFDADRALILSRQRTQKTLQGLSRQGTRILSDIEEGILTDAQILDAISPLIANSLLLKGKRTRKPRHTEKTTKKQSKKGKMGPQKDKRRTTAVSSMKPEIRIRRSSKDEDTTAVDIRQDLIQATDLLGKTVPRVHLKWQKRGKKEKEEPVFRGVVKTVIRVRKLQGHLSGILCLKFDKKRLFSAGADRTIRVWDVRTSTSVHKLYGHKGGIRCLDFDDYVLVTGSWDTTVLVWDVKMFEIVATFTEHSDCVSCVGLSEDHIVSGSYDTTIQIWSRKNWSKWKVIKGHKGPINCLSFDGTCVLSGSSDGQARLTNIFTGQCIHAFDGSQSQVLTVMVHGDLIMCGDSAGRVHFWNKKTGEGEASIQAHCEAIHGLTYHRGRFYSVSSDSSIKEWDLVTMTPIRVLQGHRGTIRHIQVSLSTQTC
ncbi:hypothetical protein ScPMuIL_014767 [Solemya velum]